MHLEDFLKKKSWFFLITALVLFAWVYFQPFIVASNIKNALADKDKMVFNAQIDFDALKNSLAHELASQISKKFPDVSSDAREKISRKKAEEVSNSTALFGSFYFFLFEIRHESVVSSSRYLSSKRFHVSFNDTNRPLLYPEWVLCREGVLSWKLCEISLPDQLLEINQKGALKPLFNVEDKAKSADPDFLLVDEYELGDDDDRITLIEFSNLVSAAYSPSSLTIKSDEGYLTISKGGHEYKITPKSGFYYKGRGYIIFDKIKKEDESYPDCHACPGNISVIQYKVDKKGINILNVTDDVAHNGVWGNSGNVFPVMYKDEGIGFVVTNGSMWQGHGVQWADAYRIKGGLITAIPELRKRKDDDSGARVETEE